jgi:hypothetical protein
MNSTPASSKIRRTRGVALPNEVRSSTRMQGDRTSARLGALRHRDLCGPCDPYYSIAWYCLAADVGLAVGVITFQAVWLAHLSVRVLHGRRCTMSAPLGSGFDIDAHLTKLLALKNGIASGIPPAMPFVVLRLARGAEAIEAKRGRSRIGKQPDRGQTLSLPGAAAGPVDGDDEIARGGDRRLNGRSGEGAAGGSDALAREHSLRAIVAEGQGHDLLRRIALHPHDVVLHAAAVLEQAELAAHDIDVGAGGEPTEGEGDGLVGAVAEEKVVRSPTRYRRVGGRCHQR